MRFFLDTASLDEISEAASWGALAGVTTNPSLYARIGGSLDNFERHIQRICELVDGPVSAEVTATQANQMVAQGLKLATLAANVAVKVPLTLDGLAATRQLANAGVEVNMTLCFSVPQALLAARAGARYVSPFVGRFDDIGDDGIAQLANIVQALSNYDFTSARLAVAAATAMSAPAGSLGGEERATSGLAAAAPAPASAAAPAAGIEVIAASIRNPNHVAQAALVGADIATVPFAVLKKCVEHPLTVNGLKAFEKDWEKVKNA
jgi:transaldolase